MSDNPDISFAELRLAQASQVFNEAALHEVYGDSDAAEAALNYAACLERVAEDAMKGIRK